ncbi:MAG: hypothetical protein HFG79_12740 [Lachnospiraceae bacterium]|nr:hypothetical protein [Lachnospiraceae bacterium]
MVAGMPCIKLRIDMFEDEKIKLIQSMPEGDTILVVWIRLIALAEKCNAGGLIRLAEDCPYTDEMLAVIFNKPLQTVRLALTTFERFRMIENTLGGICIANFDSNQSVEDMDQNVDGVDNIREQNRIRKQRERGRKKGAIREGLPLIAQGSEPEADENSDVTGMSQEKSVTSHGNVTGMSREKSVTCHGNVTGMSQEKSVTSHGNVTGMSREKSVTCHDPVTDKENEEEKDKDKERTKEKEKEREGEKEVDVSSDEDTLSSSLCEPDFEPLKKQIAYQQILEDYNRTCTDLPSIHAITDGRRKQIRALINGMDKDKIMPGDSIYERLHTLFQKAQESDFLSGRNGHWRGCAFDWLINKANALKVLEGTYANKEHVRGGNTEKRTNKFSDFPQRNYDFGEMEKQILRRE